ncbi:MAG: hypothetical protein IJ703_04200 [Eubacterium sp.]|nr:hypothetical protein [Eubacterium sp.]
MISEKNLLNDIRFFEEKLQKAKSELERLCMMVPDGARLRAVKHGSVYHYFLRTKDSGTNGKYIKEKDRDKAVILAQIEYDEKLVKQLQDAIEKRGSINNYDPFESTLEQMAPGKSKLIRPHYINDEKYISDWMDQDYIRLDFQEGFPEYYTRQGLRVRSKSEVIIADILDEMSVPFLYEKPLLLNTITVHPDFTLLNIKERSEVYWEHFGMMDDMDYRNNAFYKIRKYEATGLFQYDSVIWTFETGQQPLNTKDIRKQINRLKVKLGYED